MARLKLPFLLRWECFVPMLLSPPSIRVMAILVLTLEELRFWLIRLILFQELMVP